MRGEEIAYVTNYSGFPVPIFVNVGQYPSGEPLVTEIPAKYIRKVLLRPRSMTGFMGGIFWVESMIERGIIDPGCFDLIIPFVPGARQDRMNDKGDSLFTIKSIAKIINSLGVCVTILDPHSDVTSALINNCTVIKQFNCLSAQVTAVNSDRKSISYDGVIAPDAGAEKKAGEIARYLKIPLIHAWKTRDVATGNISGFGCEIDAIPSNTAANYLIADDICDGGGTFIGLVDAIKQYRSKVTFDLSVTHGLFTKGTEELLKRFSTIFCTDSVSTDRPGIQINQICLALLYKGN